MLRVLSSMTVAALLCAFATATSALTLYANSVGLHGIDAIDPNTGALIKNCPQSKGNGRGVVTVSNFVYYTTATNNNVYKMDFTTCADPRCRLLHCGCDSAVDDRRRRHQFWIGDCYATPVALALRAVPDERPLLGSIASIPWKATALA